ncbi:MAG: FKBP-type peptidyl-prolyl cis-trans isomerase [Clostridiales bacterium]|nr:FKBP-type peptidyl-prolyl cis-trans isomerase [Clostridiales bacterium]
MKKLLVLLLATTMLFTVGCSSKNDTNVTNEVAQNEETTETESPLDALDLDYSTGLSDNGHYSNVKASDFVEMVEYMNISIPSEVHMITEEIVQLNIDSIIANFVTTSEVMDREVVDGDTVNIDYVGSVDGVEFEGGSTGGNGAEVTIGVTSFIDDFLAQLIGHTPGESFDIEVTFPENYGAEELSGKDAVFAITLNSIIETVTPELTDAFVSENLATEFKSNTVEEFRTFVADELKANAIEVYIQNYLSNEFVVTSVPEDVLTYQQTIMQNYYKMSAAQYNMTLDEYLISYVGYETIEALTEASQEEIARTSQYALIVQGVAEDANLVVTEENLKAYFVKFTGEEDYSRFEELYGISYLKKSVLQEIVLDFLVSNAILEQ